MGNNANTLYENIVDDVFQDESSPISEEESSMISGLSLKLNLAEDNDQNKNEVNTCSFCCKVGYLLSVELKKKVLKMKKEIDQIQLNNGPNFIYSLSDSVQNVLCSVENILDMYSAESKEPFQCKDFTSINKLSTLITKVPTISKTDKNLKHLESMDIIPIQTERTLQNIIQLLGNISNLVENNGNKTTELLYKADERTFATGKTVKIYFTVMDKDTRITSFDVLNNANTFQKPCSLIEKQGYVYFFLINKMLKKIQASELEYSESKHCGHEFRFHLNCKYPQIRDIRSSQSENANSFTKNLNESISFVIDNKKKAMNVYNSCDISKLNPINTPGMHHRTVSLKHSIKKHAIFHENVRKSKVGRLSVQDIQTIKAPHTLIKHSLIIPEDRKSSQSTTLGQYKEANDICAKTTKSSFALTAKKKRTKHRRFYNSVIDRKIVPQKPGKGLIASPSQLINLNPEARVCGCARLLAVAEDFYDRTYIEGLMDLYRIKTEFVNKLETAIDTLFEFPKTHFCCPGYQYLFIFYNGQDLKYFYSIKQLKQQGKIDELVKVVVFTNYDNMHELVEDDFGIQLMLKPAKSKDIKQILSS
ncbi:unnamed protein product [Moneuplotes crassus]|uniref:Uncharacterized protein n=1 Tax=Euplotes crassus TaxID=5936 RepID=A0AAD1YA59_EUPCR|nr:unnamed protein product [Moneuplotes crassus]